MVPSNPATLTVKPLGAAVAVSSSTLTAIPDATSSTPGAAVEVPFSIAGVNGNIGEVTFSVYLTHTYVGDLVLTLLAPDGSSVILSDMAGSNGTTTSPTGAAFGTSCGTYTVFSDLGATSISSQASPPAIVGTYRPSFPLNAFNGRNANGTWKLRIQDFGPQDVGNFVCGTLSVKPFLVASLDVNADGVIDVRDLLVLAKHFGTVNTACNLDGSPDGQVTDADLTILLGGL
jgi:subtilisin-like proprotein convertase family protein